MRVYGSSPLYNYVELVFRCKRMFIVAVILGTVITSVIVYSRPTMYDAKMVMRLTGEQTVKVSTDHEDRDLPSSGTSWKLELLDFQVNHNPVYMQGVIRKANLDLRYRNVPLPKLTQDVVDKITLSRPIAESLVEVKLSWPNRGEAIDLLNSLFAAFQETVKVQESSGLTETARLYEDALKRAKDDANVAGQARLQYLQTNYFVQPVMIASLQGEINQMEVQIDEARMDAIEARQRLADINRQLQTVEKNVVQAEQVSEQPLDPALQYAADFDQAKHEYDDAIQRYSDRHPKVIELKAKMADLQQKIKDLRSQPKPKPIPVTQQRTTTLNPEYQELIQQKHEVERSVHTADRRYDELKRNMDVARTRVQKLPANEARSNEVERRYQMATTLRDQLEAKVLQARTNRDIAVQAHEMEVQNAVPPSAEKSEGSGKTVFLYALGPILGLFVAFCFSLLVESLDHTLRTPVEVEKYLGKPVLAVIPRVHSPADRKRLAGSSTSSITS